MNLLEQAHQHFSQGVACHDQDPLEAVEHYRQAVFLWPAHAPAHFNMGTLLLRLRQENEGRDHILRACQADPHNDAFKQRADELLAKRSQERSDGLAETTEPTGVNTRIEAEVPEEASFAFDGVRLRIDQLLDAALKGDVVNTTGTYRSLPGNGAPAIVGRHATMAALAHVVAARRRLRASLSAIPPGRARADAIRRIPILADLVADLRKLEEATETDHVAEAKCLTRRADSRHEEPDIAVKLYRRALSEAPDHGPAYYGLFLLQRELGEIEEAARNLSTAIHFSPGNRVFRYYQQSWIQADPAVAQFFPTTVGAGDSRLETGVHHPTVVHESGSFAVRRSMPLDDPGAVRELFDAMLEREEHDPILRLTAEAWGDLSADAVREPLATSLRIMAHVAALAHVDLALGFLLDATKAFEAAGHPCRLRQIATEVCIDTIVEM